MRLPTKIKSLAVLLILTGLAVFLFIGLTNIADADVWVNGYYRSSGTYVNGHYRSSPDGNPYNNYSYPGNTNPYTGVTAPGNPDTYLQNYYGGSPGGSSGGSYYSFPSIPTPAPTPSCPLMSSYDSLSGSCQCYSGYVADGSSCVSGLSYCWSKYGYNSSYDSLDKSCECDYGYELKYGTCTKIEKTTNLNYPFYYPTPTPIPTCPINSSRVNGTCTCNTGYTANTSKTACIVTVTPTESCQSGYGVNTYAKDGLCYCKDGYQWNSDQTACYLILSVPTPTPTPDRTPTLSPVIPNNLSAQILNAQLNCQGGYSLSLDKKRCIKIPKNAHVADNGKDVWLCNDGYMEKRNSCVLISPSLSPFPTTDTPTKSKKSGWSIFKFW